MDNEIWQDREFPEGEKQDTDIRTEWERDYARIVHSSAFRRLQAKTQVLGLGDSDFYRTRLTHSMEVAQIGTGILRFLQVNLEEKDQQEILSSLPDHMLMNSICLAHDFGHPPFGHGGEVALNICMREHGGFEGNGQTLRLLSKLEKYSESNGINPTRRLLLGVLKYPAPYSALVQKNAYSKLPAQPWLSSAKLQTPPKCYLDDERELIEWVLKPFSDAEKKEFTETIKDGEKMHRQTIHQSLDTSIMDLADDISYGVHDLEDSIELKLITRDDWEGNKKIAECKEYVNENFPYDYETLTNNLFSGESFRLKKSIGDLVHHFISNISINYSRMTEASSPLLKWNAVLKKDTNKFLDAILSIVTDKVIKSPSVQQLEFKGQKIIIDLFTALASDPKRILPEGTKTRYEQTNSDHQKKRVHCDLVSVMTDEYAIKLYERLFSPSKGSVFEII